MKKLFLLLAVVGMALTACSEGGVDDDINNGGNNTEQPGGGEDGGEDNPDIPADKTQAIKFHDRNTKLICTIFWDKNGDGELSYEEAAAVTHLDDTAFKDSSIVLFNELKYFTSLKKIGDYAFSGCHSLASITIPDSVILIGKEAFRDCIKLKSVYISDIAAWCNISFGDYYANPLCYANLYLNDELVTDLTIPDSVTSIGDYAFFGGNSFSSLCSIKSVTIGNGVTTIGYGAFAYCGSLQSVTIGNGVTTIGDFAFDGCMNIKSVYLSDIAAWCNISFGAHDANPLCYANLYLNDELVTDLTIPDSVTAIGSRAFYGCSSLTSVTIPDSVTTIGYRAFYGCGSLTSITISDSVTTIGGGAFAYCDSLTSITIPDSVTAIGDEAFSVCSSLTSITIPDSVTAIGYEAFEVCSSLESVYCKPTTPPSIEYDVFDGNASGRKIYVPAESVEAYKTASYWSDYASDIVGYDF